MYTHWEFGNFSRFFGLFPMDFIPNCSQLFPIVPNLEIRFDQKWVFLKTGNQLKYSINFLMYRRVKSYLLAEKLYSLWYIHI